MQIFAELRNSFTLKFSTGDDEHALEQLRTVLAVLSAAAMVTVARVLMINQTLKTFQTNMDSLTTFGVYCSKRFPMDTCLIKIFECSLDHQAV